MLRLLLVHGPNQHYRIPAEVQQRWEWAVRWGLERAGASYHRDIPLSFAFYGDIWRADDPERVAPRSSEALAGVELGLAHDVVEQGDLAPPPADVGERLGWDDVAALLAFLDVYVGRK